MRSVREFRAWAAAKYRTGHRAWLGRDDGGAGVQVEFPLQPPSEDAVAADPARAASWVREWRDALLPAGATVAWVRRRWRSYGEQDVPTRVHVQGAGAIASLAGESAAWSGLTGTAAAITGTWPQARIALPGAAGALGRLADGDLPRLLATVEWFSQNPASELLARQVPVEGVDTKWLERHRGLVQRLVGAVTGTTDLGLRVEPRRFRVRVLGAPIEGDIRDFTAPASELAGLGWRPGRVLVCENQQTMAALPDSLGLVAVHGNGLAAPGLGSVPWIRDARLAYWGDLDTHGFAILSLVRQALPHAESLLMDAATLARFRPLAGSEPLPFRGAIGHLTASEQRALAELRRADLRLEQERIPLSHAVPVLEAWERPGGPA